MNTEELLKKSKELLSLIEDDFSKIAGSVKDDLFFLHNELCDPKEYGKACSKCVRRTWERLKQFCKKN